MEEVGGCDPDGVGRPKGEASVACIDVEDGGGGGAEVGRDHCTGDELSLARLV